MDSRVDSTRVVGEALAQVAQVPRVWLQESTATLSAHTFGPARDEERGVIGGDEPDAPAYWKRSIDIADRLPAAGFAFRFTDWETAAGDLVTRWRARG